MARFKVGDLVRKVSGSNWHGTVCGTYSTELTPEGYAVESYTEKGSVQIYPSRALELWNPGAVRSPVPETVINNEPVEVLKTHTEPHLINEEAAAALLGVKPGTLSIWRCTGRYNLPYIKIGAKVRYQKNELLEWMSSRTRGNKD
jgi:predicted DNA-binding transcriptional regulator AlpA